MKSVCEHLFRRGSRGAFCLRRLISAHLSDAFPQRKREVLPNLRTSDPELAKRRLRTESARVDGVFERAGKRLDQRWQHHEQRTVHTLSDEQMDELARGWVHAVLQTDEEARRQGLDDQEFAELGERIHAQLADVGALLAQGRTDKALPAPHG